MQTSPFTIAVEAAEKLRMPLASVGILSAVAAAQIDAGLLEDAFITVTKIPAKSDQRSVLLNSAINAVNNKLSEVAFRLINKLVEIDSESSVVAGRLARTFLDNNEPVAAMKIIKSINNPFDSWRSRCEFAVKLLEFDIDGAKGIIETINDLDYRDWGGLALMQRIIQSGDLDLAIKLAGNFSSPLRCVWAFFELVKLSDGALVLRLFEAAAVILRTIDIDVKNAEALATVLRIIGKYAYDFGKAKSADVGDTNALSIGVAVMSMGESFLELSEAAVMMISVPVQRLRSKLFLAGTLLELGLIDGADMYIDRREIKSGDFNAIEQSKVWQWAAECDPRWELDWVRAVRAVSFAQRKSEELGLAERMSEVVRRFALRNSKLKPTGKPNEDLINLPARQFEEYYYSPFAIEDCEC
jgi:hypothetical protein